MPKEKFKGKDIFDKYYGKDSLVGLNKHKCLACGNIHTQNTSKGYTNRIDHVNTEHVEEYFKLWKHICPTKRKQVLWTIFLSRKSQTKPKRCNRE